MGTNTTLTTFVSGVVISASAVNADLTNINHATRFFFNVGSIKGIMNVPGTVNAATNFTNTLGAVPDFGVGCSDAGAFHMVCWNKNTSSSSIVNIIPDSANGGTHWNTLFFLF